MVAGGWAARSEEQLPLKARAFSEGDPNRQVLSAKTFLNAGAVHADRWHDQTSIVVSADSILGSSTGSMYMLKHSPSSCARHIASGNSEIGCNFLAGLGSPSAGRGASDVIPQDCN